MKAFIAAAALLLASTSALAETQLLTCQVPNGPVVMNISLADDQQVDFVTVTLNEKAGPAFFFSQMDKGEVQAQMNAGFLNLLALTENSGQVDGVIVNTGFLGLSKEANGTFGGFLAAKGNIYPLTCTK